MFEHLHRTRQHIQRFTAEEFDRLNRECRRIASVEGRQSFTRTSLIRRALDLYFFETPGSEPEKGPTDGKRPRKRRRSPDTAKSL